MEFINTDSFDIKQKPNEFFKYYHDIFNQLLIAKNVNEDTEKKCDPKIPLESDKKMFPLVSAAISFDSKVAITISKKSEREFWLKMYSLTASNDSNGLVFEEKIGGGENQYIKCKEIVQNEAGNKYAICFFDDGKFRFRTIARDEVLVREWDKVDKEKKDVTDKEKLKKDNENAKTFKRTKAEREQFKGKVEVETRIRTEEEIKNSEVDVNSLLWLDDHTMPI